MGRSLNFYALPCKMEHDTSKKLCFNWDFQDDEEIMRDDIYERVKDPNDKDDLSSGMGYFKNLTKQEEKKCEVLYNYMYTDNAEKSHWCPVCYLYASGIYGSSLIIAEESVNHSYSNPIWNSRWNIKDQWIGSSNTSFVRKFRDDSMYREVTAHDIEIALERLDELGTPLRQSDKEACEETTRVLQFLKHWTEKDDIIVILEDEC